MLDSNPSQIFGHLIATGQVFLTNPNGVYFAPGASVSVGGLVATTHSLSNSDFMAGSNTFTRNGATGAVVNDGNLTAALGGYIALLAPEVRNNGIIVAQLGTVALAAGESYNLKIDSNNSLINLRVDPATIAALVENGNAVHAPGGLIILSAQAANRLQGGVVNNRGTLEATGLVDNGGVIRLSASDSISHSGIIKVDAAKNSSGNGGTVSLIADLSNASSNTTVAGSISARGGTLGGNGGFVETSGERVHIASNTTVDTGAPQGLTGSWLLDPVDFTIAASGGDLTGTTLSNNLDNGSGGGTDISISSSSGTQGGSLGNINVNDAVTWGAHKLTLTASNDININAVMTANNTASLDLEPGSNHVNVGFNGGGTFSGRVDFFQADGVTPRSGTGFLTINNLGYTVITDLGVAGDATSGVATLQGMAATANLNGYYALGSNIDATALSNEAGFAPIGSGSGSAGFRGIFNGLGHVINNLVLYQPTAGQIGLFGQIELHSVVTNVGLENVTVTGKNGVGGLVGKMNYGGAVSNSYVTGSITGNGVTGGLVGGSYGQLGIAPTISNSHTNVTVTVMNYGIASGGLVGRGDGAISDSYSAGSVVSNGNFSGGLVGINFFSDSTISNSHSTTTVTNTGGDSIGGLFGGSFNPTVITNSYATGDVSGSSKVGGLVGDARVSTIIDSYARSNVTGTGASVGGLVGASDPITTPITNSYYDIGSVSVKVGDASPVAIGGAEVTPYGLYTPQFNDWLNGGKVMPAISTYMGAADASGYYTLTSANIQSLLGYAGNPLFTSAKFNLSADVELPGGYWIPQFTATEINGAGYKFIGLTFNQPLNDVMGLLGILGASSTVKNLGVTGTSITGNTSIGGLVGLNFGSVINSYAAVQVNGNSVNGDNVGGLVGVNYGGTISNSYATGDVTSGGSKIGGLVGANLSWGTNYGTISNSYATGAVNGGSYMGGLVGTNAYNGMINNSYATGAVTGSGYVGGLVGANTGTINNSYATGLVTGGSYTGGLVGLNYGTVNNSFYDNTVNSGLTGIGNVSDTPGTVWGMSTADMKITANFTEATTANGSVNPGWDFTPTTGTWAIDGSVNSGYPSLIVVSPAPSGGGSTTIYVDLITGSSIYGNTPIFSWGYFTDAAGSSAASVVGLPSGSLSWSGAPTSASIVGGYSLTYNGSLSLSSYTFTAGNPVTWNITARPVTLTGSRIYNGSTAFTGTQLSLSNTVNGDNVSLSGGTAQVASKNVGTASFTSFSGLGLSGPQAGNYTLSGASGSGTISQRPNEAWVGGSIGNWSNPANWYIGAIPDLSNVAAVSIPAGTTVTYDSGMVSPTYLSSLNDKGKLIMASGSLNTSGGVTTTGFQQTGGSLNVGTGLVIKSVSGDVQLGDIVAHNVNISATGGAITQLADSSVQVATGTVLAADNGLSGGSNLKYAITLNNSGNDFGGYLTATGNGISLADKNSLTVMLSDAGSSSLTAASFISLVPSSNIAGNLTTLTTGSGLTWFGLSHIGGDLSVTSAGVINQSTEGITVGGTSSLSGTAINLANSIANDFGQAVSATGVTVSLADKNALTANVTSSKGTLLNAVDVLNLGNINVNNLNATAQSLAQLNATHVSVAGSSKLTATGNIVLNHTDNSFTGIVTATGNGISLSNSKALSVLLSDAGSASLVAAGNLSLLAGSSAANNLTAQTTATNNTTWFGQTSVGGNLSVTSSGAILQSPDGLGVGGTSQLSGSTINLGSALNDFGGAVTASGTNITLTDKNALTASVNSSGATLLNAGGDLLVDGSTGTTLTTVTTATTTFGNTTVGTNLKVTSTGVVSKAPSKIVTVSGNSTTSPNIKVSINGSHAGF